MDQNAAPGEKSPHRLLIHLGTQKAASTYIWQLARQNPQIATHYTNELHCFFDNDFDVAKYFTYFSAEKAALFENSPAYFRDDDAALKIHKNINNFFLSTHYRFSIILRDPVTYLASLYTMYQRQNVLPERGRPPV